MQMAFQASMFTTIFESLLENQTTKNSAQDILQDLDYTFYDSGNIHELLDNVITDASYTYEYDQLQRVKKATRFDGKIFNYAFDEKGNLTLKENRTQGPLSEFDKAAIIRIC